MQLDKFLYNFLDFSVTVMNNMVNMVPGSHNQRKFSAASQSIQPLVLTNPLSFPYLGLRIFPVKHDIFS